MMMVGWGRWEAGFGGATLTELTAASVVAVGIWQMAIAFSAAGTALSCSEMRPSLTAPKDLGNPAQCSEQNETADRPCRILYRRILAMSPSSGRPGQLGRGARSWSSYRRCP